MNCGKNQSWLLMLGCFLPIILIIALPLFGVKSAYLSWLALLACPLAMFAMMHMNKNESKPEKQMKRKKGDGYC